MADITRVVFGKLLRFSDFPQVKSFFLQKKLNIDSACDTDRIVKRGPVKETIKTDDLIELVVDESLIFYD
jgi:hypothetical protein